MEYARLDRDAGQDARRRRETRDKKPSVAHAHPPWLPPARRFWADFTLGFADGLTVPFALTAGLSSLGRTDTVVFAGLAEVSAGCISMGIGGYLSARQSSRAAVAEMPGMPGRVDTVETVNTVEAAETGLTETAEKGHVVAAAHHYIAPLALPADLQKQVMAYITTQQHAAEGLLAASRQRHATSPVDYTHEYGYGYDGYDGYDECRLYIPAQDAARANNDATAAVRPIVSGLSVALGYLVGGLLPLGPYFFVAHVGDGLRYSFVVCVLALFLFGFGKDLLLDAPSTTAAPLSLRRSRIIIPWQRLSRSTWEGLQMVLLGGTAALAAVLCVRLFDKASTGGGP